MPEQNKCISCGKLLDSAEGALFCPFCGARQTIATTPKSSSIDSTSAFQSDLAKMRQENQKKLDQIRSSYNSSSKSSFSSQYSTRSSSGSSFGSSFSHSSYGSSFGSSATIGRKDHGADVYEKNINGILEIMCMDKDNTNQVAQGSGFVINADGFALTNAHVVTHEDGTPFEMVFVRICGETIPAHIIALGDDKHGSGDGVDLALLKLGYLPDNVAVLDFENPENIRNGERVFVIGNSLGLGTCITNGVVSDKERYINLSGTVLMTDCPVNPGNSGGPIFNDKGLVIGVIVATMVGVKGMNYAITLDRTKEFVKAVLGIDIY